MATLAGAVTGRERLGDILSGFTKLTKRLDTFVGQRMADADKHAQTEATAREARAAAVADVDRASRTKAKIADLVG